MDRKVTGRWLGGGILLITLAIFFLVLWFREPILLRAGRFMAPEENGTADVAILEGAEMIETAAVFKGLNLLSSGKIDRLMIVLHEPAGGAKSFALQENYPTLLQKGLMNLGLRAEQFRVVKTPVRHPVTLTEAKLVLGAVSKEGGKSAILLSNGFHMRRSFLAYQSLAKPLKIKIIPSAYFSDYELDRWWIQDPAVHEFLSEFLKLLYYQARGYIPLTSKN